MGIGKTWRGGIILLMMVVDVFFASTAFSGRAAEVRAQFKRRCGSLLRQSYRHPEKRRQIQGIDSNVVTRNIPYVLASRDASWRTDLKIQPRDQRSMGTCWIHSPLRVLEIRARKRGLRVALSHQYILAQHWIDQALAVAKGEGESIDEIPIAGRASEIFRKYGFVTRQAYQWRGRHSIETSEEKKQALLVLLKRLALIGSQAYRKAPSRVTLQVIRLSLERAIERYTGAKLPREFLHQGELVTPLAFSQKPWFASPLNEEIDPFDKIHLENTQYHSIEFFDAIQRQLDQTGEPIEIWFRWHEGFIDRKQGRMSLKSFTSPYQGDPTTLMQSLDDVTPQGEHAGLHDALVVDYATDRRGRVTSLRLLNSHGRDDGQQGYYDMDRDFFEAMTDSLFVLPGFDPHEFEHE